MNWLLTLSAIFILLSPPQPSYEKTCSPNGDVAYVEFTNKTTFDDLVSIKAEFAKKGIELAYLLIEFDENKTHKVNGESHYALTALSFNVSCSDGSSGSGKCLNFMDGDVLSFLHDTRKGAPDNIKIELRDETPR